MVKIVTVITLGTNFLASRNPTLVQLALGVHVPVSLAVIVAWTLNDFYTVVVPIELVIVLALVAISVAVNFPTILG